MGKVVSPGDPSPIDINTIYRKKAKFAYVICLEVSKQLPYRKVTV